MKSTSTNRILRMATSSTCLSTGIVYLIQCARCRIQYVGQSSNSIHVQFQQHMRYVKLRDEYKPISTHYNSPGHSMRDSKVLALDCSKNLNARLRLEDTWSTCLGSLQPAGLNHRYQRFKMPELTGPVICPECQQSFKTAKSERRHYIREHNKHLLMYICEWCGLK